MKTLQTIKLKPNPAGKDKTKNGTATAAQLGAEWVDLKNTGTAPVDLQGVKLYHVAFVGGKASHWELVTSFTGTLGVGEIVRIHGGHGPLNALDVADQNGAHHHIFRKANTYIWNNAEGDTSRITEPSGTGEGETDKASYDPYPPEGVVLVRSGNKLVPSGVGAYASAFGSR